jgi:hypothetical protein
VTVPFSVSPALTVVLSSAKGVEITNPPAAVIIQLKEAGVDTLPAGSAAVTEKVWLPAARPA